MNLTRCDECCNVIDGIDDGEVFECSTEVYESIQKEHLCLDCVNQNEELEIVKSGYTTLIKWNNQNIDAHIGAIG